MAQTRSHAHLDKFGDWARGGHSRAKGRLPSLAPPFQAAARVGGRLTCISLASAAGLWIPSGEYGLHVAVGGNACQLRSTFDYHSRLAERADLVTVHWNDDGAGSRIATSVESALVRLTGCLPVESAFVVCESALFHRELSAVGWARVLASMPEGARKRLRLAGALSESGSESFFRFRSHSFGVRVRQQVSLGRYRVDFLLGDRLVVEIDSVAHHDPTADAVRDAVLSTLGFRVLRFMYSQVVGDWASVFAAVMAAISRGDHLPG